MFYKKVVLLSFVFTSFLFPIDDGDKKKVSQITISGYAEKNVPADRLKVTINFWEKDESVKNVKDKIAKHQKHIKELLKTIGFKDEMVDIHPHKTTEFKKWVKGVQKNNYMLSGVITATTCNVSLGQNIGEQMMDLSDRGIKYNMNVNYILTDASALKSELQEQALQNAQKSACEAAQSVHMALGPVVDVAHYGNPTVDKQEKGSMKKVHLNIHLTYELKKP
ncbi:MAG: hypothetical protein HEEMFOPI_00128 [Holosporales bacterium]